LSDFSPAVPGDGEWLPFDPTPVDGRAVANIPGGSIRSAQIREVSVSKVQGVAVEVYATGAQTVLTGVAEPWEFTTESYRQEFQPGASNLISLPYDGFYLVRFKWLWANSSLSTRDVRIQVNGNSVTGDENHSASGTPRYTLFYMDRLDAGDTIGVNIESGTDTTMSSGLADTSLAVAMLFSL
jgi:hypothetical protein